MAFLGKIFGSKPGPKKSSAEIMEGLGHQDDLMVKRVRVLQRQIDAAHQQAREQLAKGPAAREQAKRLLAKKKRLQKNLDQIEAQRGNLHGVQLVAEDSALQAAYVQTIQSTTAHLKAQQAGIEKIEDITEEAQEVVRAGQEAADALAQPLFDMPDEAELEAELDAMELEGVGSKKAAAAQAGTKRKAEGAEPPTAKRARPAAAAAAPAQKKPEEEETVDETMARLEAEMQPVAA
eukprot:TRINITY_DN2816_c0_g2_i1.p2 TRINITY_DN2816_c0_g2~~TRINITY_DN2816_c0_g2_i1.p2  ORF type:complete len:235 (+),score=112.50 TRINITY_DN2816_c0_g2_i1:83-787(+)